MLTYSRCSKKDPTVIIIIVYQIIVHKMKIFIYLYLPMFDNIGSWKFMHLQVLRVTEINQYFM